METLDRLVVEAVKRLAFVQNVREEGNNILVALTDPGRNPELVKTIVASGGKVLGVTEKQYPLEEV